MDLETSLKVPVLVSDTRTCMVQVHLSRSKIRPGKSTKKISDYWRRGNYGKLKSPVL